MTNPEKALDAIISPDPVTLGQLALLDRIGSPLIDGHSTAVADVAPSLWLLSLPIKEAAERWSEAEVQGILYVNKMTYVEFLRATKKAYNAVGAFYEMLPAAEDGDKKKVVTD